MKIRLFLSILSVFVLFSCYKESEKLPYEDFDLDTKKYMIFEVGSSWIYQVRDSNNPLIKTVEIELQEVKTEIVESKDGESRVPRRIETYFDHYHKEFFYRTISDTNITYYEPNLYKDDDGSKDYIKRENQRVYVVRSKFGTYYSKVEGPTYEYASNDPSNPVLDGDILSDFDILSYLNGFYLFGMSLDNPTKFVTSGEDYGNIGGVNVLRYNTAYSDYIGLVYHSDIEIQREYKLISYELK